MQKEQKTQLNFHQTPEEFIASIEYTVAQTGFRAELIEKDYYCSVILENLYTDETCPIIFKGGTLLAKVFGDFYRLSEDLDFVLPLEPNISRQSRRKAINPVKEIYNNLPQRITDIAIETNLQGSNESSQYNGELTYSSLITQDIGRIKFEVSLRESMLETPVEQRAKTLLLNPFTGSSIVTPYPIKGFSLKEAYAEKFRAALCRPLPAIRDYYDISHALNNKILKITDDFIAAVKEKIQLQIKTFEKVNSEKLTILRQQVQTELLPTLKMVDYEKFDLDTVALMLNDFCDKYL